MRSENCLLRQYKTNDYNVVADKLISRKYLQKYLNKGLFLSTLSFLGLYKSTLYLLESENEIVASGVIRQKVDFVKLKKNYWLYGIEVSEKQRGNGFGSLLIKELLDILKNKHIKQVYLKVARNNVIALNLYAKYGFVKYNEQQDNYVLICKLT